MEIRFQRITRRAVALALAALTAMFVTGCGIGNVQSHRASRATGHHSRLAVGSRGQSEGTRGTALGPTHIVTSSWYGPGYDGHRTASGERFDPNGLTAASKTLPLGSSVRVTNLKDGHSAQVKINDRGPGGTRPESRSVARGGAADWPDERRGGSCQDHSRE